MTERFAAGFLVVAGAIMAAGGVAQAADPPNISIMIKDHRFDASEYQAPAGTKVKLSFHNGDVTNAEVESRSMHFEKVVQGGKDAAVFVGPLNAGKYEFFDDFHRDTAKATLVVQ